MELRQLEQRDDRSMFRSGDPDLDRFFHKFAGQNQFRHHIGVTYVAVETARIVGYATVSPGHVEIDRLPLAARRKFPGYPLPVLRLARLGVYTTAQGHGVGKLLLRFVLQLGLKMTGDYGCVGVVVDAKPGAVEFYARFGFMPMEALVGQAEARPAPVPMFLATNVIADGASARTRG